MARLRQRFVAFLGVVVLAAVVAAPTVATPTVSGMDPARAAALDAALVQARKNRNAPGLSLAIRLADGRRGFEAQMWYVPSRDVSITLMSNRGNQSLRPVVQQLLAVLFEGS